ncbi:FAD-dependent oxidoreductase [Gluconobacter cerinus]|uniref:FAD-dependent oxidoreductase n=1 Tax=Gluconobacter cerinus TaxID=38307 RepID=UPI0024B101BE|nr:FAD-dependent oxidoreductase [Gluconobacter cerinus]
MRFCIVGAGFSGAIIARHLSEKGYKFPLLDKRSNIAGNCHTERGGFEKPLSDCFCA